MTWYAAHIVMAVLFKDGDQNKYPISEHIILIKAKSDIDAYKKALKIGKDAEGDAQGTFSWELRPASWVCAGIRKIIETENPKVRPDNGTEITYTEFELRDEETLKKFISGKPVSLHYEK